MNGFGINEKKRNSWFVSTENKLIWKIRFLFWWIHDEYVVVFVCVPMLSGLPTARFSQRLPLKWPHTHTHKRKRPSSRQKRSQRQFCCVEANFFPYLNVEKKAIWKFEREAKTVVVEKRHGDSKGFPLDMSLGCWLKQTRQRRLAFVAKHTYAKYPSAWRNFPNTALRPANRQGNGCAHKHSYRHTSSKTHRIRSRNNLSGLMSIQCQNGKCLWANGQFFKLFQHFIRPPTNKRTSVDEN